GRGEVPVRAEPDDADVAADPGHGPQRREAVDREHQWEPVVGDRPAHGRADPADDVERVGDLVRHRTRLGPGDDDRLASDRLCEQSRPAAQVRVRATEVPGHLDQADVAHPRSVESLSTSSSSLRRWTATISPSPTTTSEAATAITASAKICPSRSAWFRENVINARFAPLSMISIESRTISGLRRSMTPSAPIANRNAETA